MDIRQLMQNMRIEALTPMQQAAFHACQGSHNVVLLAPTGSGKTLAYLLPLVQKLDPESQDVQAIVLVPSRELALQTEMVFKQLGTPFKAMSCYGGRPAMEEHRTMNAIHPHVIIGTPGRMNDHLRKKNFDATPVHILVIDEFDKSLELGFREEMNEVLSQLPAKAQRILLSATDTEDIPHFVRIGTQTERIDFRNESVEARLDIRQVHSLEKDKLKTLHTLLCTLGNDSTLVFVNYRESAERTAGYLLANHMTCDVFHGGMEQLEREKALYRFRNGSCPILVCTDLAARGLDIQGVKNIVHYHLPQQKETFTHRNGRTARWQSQGTVYLILHPEEYLPEYILQDVPEVILPQRPPQPSKPQWITLYIGKGKKDKLSKTDIVGFLCKKGSLTREDLGQIDVKDHYAFAAVRREKVKQLLQLVRGEKIKGMKTIIEEAL